MFGDRGQSVFIKYSSSRIGIIVVLESGVVVKSFKNRIVCCCSSWRKIWCYDSGRGLNSICRNWTEGEITSDGSC